MKHLFNVLDTFLAQLSVLFIKLYQYTISPDKGIFSAIFKGRICSHEPHCSEYAIRTLKRYGFINGIGKVTDRVLHCKASMQKVYDPEHYRVVLMCSASIGVPFISELKNDKRFEVVGIVTQADKPVGRGLHLQENIIKSSAKELFPNQGKKIKKLLIIHGFASAPQEIRFPRLKHHAEQQWIEVAIPKLPSFKSHTLENQIDFLMNNYQQRIDKDTAIIAHSLGGILAKHFLIKTNKTIKTLIDIAPAYPGRDYTVMKQQHSLYAKSADYLNTYVNQHTIDHKQLSEQLTSHHIYISKDDPIINYDNTYEYHTTHYPNAHLKTFEDKEHFLKITEFPELLTELTPDFSDFIQTPNKINPEKSLEGNLFYNRLKEKNPDYLVVIAYGKILPQSILDIPHFGPINVHGSLLPKYRGASPLQSVFLNKETTTWITIMKMDAGMDTGDIIDTLSFPIPFSRTVKELIQALEKQWPTFLNTTLRNFGKGLIKAEKQDEHQASYCQKIEKADGFFVLSTDTLEEIYAKYRALFLRPKARFIRQDKRIIIEKLSLNEELFEIHKTSPLLDNGKLNVAIKDILLKPEGKKAIDWKSFVNGYLK